MTDYNTLKVAELHTELQQRGIAFEKKHKKADLVALLQAHDVSAAAAPNTSAAPAPVALAEPVTSVKLDNSIAADSTALGTASTDAIADSTNASTLPGTNDPAAEAAPSAADIEIEKRKARAAKFGVPYVEPTAPSAKPPKTKSSASANGAPKAAITAATAVKPTVAVEDPEVLARRRAKFGPLPGQTETTSATEPSPPSAAAVDPAAAERARIDEEKKKARQERFKVQPAQPSSEASAAGLKRQSSIPLEQEEPAEKKAKA